MKQFTLVLTLDKYGNITSEMPCLPRASLPGSDLVAGPCAAPEASQLRRRAALWMLSDAKQRRKKGIAGVAIVAVQMPREPGGERIFYADYCFKAPRKDMTSGSTNGLTWSALASLLILAAPTTKRTRRPRRRRASAAS